MICVAVTYEIQAGQEQEAIELFRALAAATRSEPGCRLYLVHQDPANTRRFLLYEQYENQAALDAHRAAPHFERYVKQGLWPITEKRVPEVARLLDL